MVDNLKSTRGDVSNKLKARTFLKSSDMLPVDAPGQCLQNRKMFGYSFGACSALLNSPLTDNPLPL
jgi:hypothetical protein